MFSQSDNHGDDNIALRNRVVRFLASEGSHVAINRLIRTCDNHESADTGPLDTDAFYVNVGNFGRYMGDIDDRATGTFNFRVEGVATRRVRVVRGRVNVFHLALDLYNGRDATNVASFPPAVAECIHYVWMVVSTEIAPASINQMIILVDSFCTTRTCRCDHLATEFVSTCRECNFR